MHSGKAVLQKTLEKAKTHWVNMLLQLINISKLQSVGSTAFKNQLFMPSAHSSWTIVSLCSNALTNCHWKTAAISECCWETAKRGSVSAVLTSSQLPIPYRIKFDFNLLLISTSLQSSFCFPLVNSFLRQPQYLTVKKIQIHKPIMF